MAKDGLVLHQFNLPCELSAHLHALTTAPGSSMTQIVIDALTAHFARHASHELDDRFALRLDRHSRAIERLERQLGFVSEALGTFIQHQMTLVAHHPPFDVETAKLGRRRYEAFIDLVGRRIADTAKGRVQRPPVRNQSGQDQAGDDGLNVAPT